jgi:hypothetical protein
MIKSKSSYQDIGVDAGASLHAASQPRQRALI